MKRFIVPVGVLVLIAGAYAWSPAWRSPAFWHAFVDPGPLSAAHAHLSGDCFACHVRTQGAAAERCIGCHAADMALLQRQSTAFHADIGACAQCHREHDPSHPTRSRMDHAVLARRGHHLLQIAADQHGASVISRPAASAAAALDCHACHRPDDRHAGFFGSRCADCHSTERWTIAEYRHPSSNSVDCEQCHAAPPSHYMGHFSMVSQAIAGHEADVEQCHLCHQPSSWNDIRGVGFYDHH